MPWTWKRAKSYMSKFGGRKERGDDVIILISKTKENFKNPQKNWSWGLYVCIFPHCDNLYGFRVVVFIDSLFSGAIESVKYVNTEAFWIVSSPMLNTWALCEVDISLEYKNMGILPFTKKKHWKKSKNIFAPLLVLDFALGGKWTLSKIPVGRAEMLLWLRINDLWSSGPA